MPKNGFCSSQQKYALCLLKETRVLGVRPAQASDPYFRVGSWNLLFHRQVGRLIYLTITQPNIAYVVSHISQFMHKLCTFKCILSSISLSRTLYVITSLDIVMQMGHESTTLYQQALYVSWETSSHGKAKKKTIVAWTRVEAEYRKLGYGFCHKCNVVVMFAPASNGLFCPSTHVPLLRWPSVIYSYS